MRNVPVPAHIKNFVKIHNELISNLSPEMQTKIRGLERGTNGEPLKLDIIYDESTASKGNTGLQNKVITLNMCHPSESVRLTYCFELINRKNADTILERYQSFKTSYSKKLFIAVRNILKEKGINVSEYNTFPLADAAAFKELINKLTSDDLVELKIRMNILYTIATQGAEVITRESEGESRYFTAEVFMELVIKKVVSKEEWPVQQRYLDIYEEGVQQGKSEIMIINDVSEFMITNGRVGGNKDLVARDWYRANFLREVSAEQKWCRGTIISNLLLEEYNRLNEIYRGGSKVSRTVPPKPNDPIHNRKGDTFLHKLIRDSRDPDEIESILKNYRERINLGDFNIRNVLGLTPLELAKTLNNSPEFLTKIEAIFLELKTQVKDQHLKRSEKGELLHKQGTTDGAGKRSYDFREELLAVNKGKEEAIKNLVAKESDSANALPPHCDGRTAGKKGTVTFMSEENHLVDHEANTRQLIDQIKQGKIGSNTVIALERKEGGEKLGMNDVRTLAAILEYNSDNKNQNKVALPKDIENSPIYWDAMLYNTAKSYGIRVLGVEGKGLEHDQSSPQYNEDREAYMAKQISQLAEQGYDVIMPIGSAHVQSMENRLDLGHTQEQSEQQPSKPSSQLPEIPPNSDLITNEELLGMVVRQIKNESLRGRADDMIKIAIADAKMDGKTTNEFLMQLYEQILKKTRELPDPLFFNTDNLKTCICQANSKVEKKQEAAVPLSASEVIKPESDLEIEDQQERKITCSLN